MSIVILHKIYIKFSTTTYTAFCVIIKMLRGLHRLKTEYTQFIICFIAAAESKFRCLLFWQSNPIENARKLWYIKLY